MRLSLLVSLFSHECQHRVDQWLFSLFCAFGQPIGSAQLLLELGCVTAAVGHAELVSKFDVLPRAEQNKHSNTSWEWASSLSLRSACFPVLSEGRP